MKKLLVLAMSAMMIFAANSTASAATHTNYESSPATTPIKLTMEKTGLDFTVSENISIEAEADTVIPTSISDYTIKNNNNSSYMKVDSIEVTGGQWASVAYSDKDTFLGYNIDAKKFALKVKSIATTKSHDGALSGERPDLNSKWNTVGKIWYGETMTIGFDSFVTPVSEALDGTESAIASIVATVSIGE